MPAYVCGVVLLTLALVAQLLQQATAAAPCQTGTLLDARAPASSQPIAPTASLAVKVRAKDTVIIDAISIFMNPGGSAPALVTINVDEGGAAGTAVRTYGDVTVIDAAQYRFKTEGSLELSAGLYWFVFRSSDGSEINGWSWSQWSGADDVHSLSFAAATYADDLVPRLLIDGCGVSLASPSPSPSVSPSGIPQLKGLINATAEFEPVQAAFLLSGTFGTSSGASGGSTNGGNSSSESSLSSKLSSVQIGNATLLASDLAGTTTREEIPDQGEGKPLTYVYTTSLLNATTELHQSFAFHKRSARASFAGVEFEIDANSVKWSLNFTSANSSSSSSSSSSPPHTTTVRYQLAGADRQLTSPGRANIVRRANTPSEGLTTYYLPLHLASSSQSVFATVALFDLAVVDGVVTPVRHNITLVPAANADTDADAGNATQAQYYYEVAVELPAFDQWVHYDPSVGMGLLLGADGRGSGSDNTDLIVAVAVAVPVAVAMVFVVILAGVVFAWYKQRALRSSNTSINFDAHDGAGDQSDAL